MPRLISLNIIIKLIGIGAERVKYLIGNGIGAERDSRCSVNMFC